MSLEEGEGVALLLLNAGSSRDRSPCIHMRLVAYTWVCCIRLFFNTCRPLFKQRLTCIQKVAKKDICSDSMSKSIVETSIDIFSL